MLSLFGGKKLLFYQRPGTHDHLCFFTGFYTSPFETDFKTAWLDLKEKVKEETEKPDEKEEEVKKPTTPTTGIEQSSIIIPVVIIIAALAAVFFLRKKKDK